MKVLHKLFAVALALSLAVVGAQAQTFYAYNEHNAPENRNKNEDGNTKINTRLSSQRAENVKKILMDKYNVPASQIVIKSTLISDAHEDGRLDRCVLIENK